MNCFEKKCDKELVEIIKNEETSRKDRNYAYEALFNRYKRCFDKNWYKLQLQMDKSRFIMSKEDDFYSDAYEAFLTAIDKVDLSKIENNNWKLIGYLDFYLRNVRSKIIKGIMKKESKVKSISYMNNINNDSSSEDISRVDSDVEMSYWVTEGYKTEPEYRYLIEEEEERCVISINKCLKKWTPFEREIFELLKSGKSKSDIATIKNITPSRVYLVTKSMKKDFKKYMEA